MQRVMNNSFWFPLFCDLLFIFNKKDTYMCNIVICKIKILLVVYDKKRP